MYAYCMFCETQRCKQIAEYIRVTRGITCISPVIIQRKWIKGTPIEEAHDWLPGYLFLYTEEPSLQRFDVDGIIRILGNGPLNGHDLKFAEMIYRRNGIIGSISLAQEGTVCTISDPAWNDLHGKVIRLDRGRRRCCVEYKFDGVIRKIWLGYKIVRSIK